MEKVSISELLFATDIIITAESEENLQHNVAILKTELEKTNMKIEVHKTKMTVITYQDKTH